MLPPPFLAGVQVVEDPGGVQDGDPPEGRKEIYIGDKSTKRWFKLGIFATAITIVERASCVHLVTWAGFGDEEVMSSVARGKT